MTTKTTNVAVITADLLAALKAQAKQEALAEIRAELLGGVATAAPNSRKLATSGQAKAAPKATKAPKKVVSLVTGNSRGPSTQRSKDGQSPAEFIRSCPVDMKPTLVVEEAEKVGLKFTVALVYNTRRYAAEHAGAKAKAAAVAEAAPVTATEASPEVTATEATPEVTTAPEAPVTAEAPVAAPVTETAIVPVPAEAPVAEAPAAPKAKRSHHAKKSDKVKAA